jgi:hypothetical protein
MIEIKNKKRFPVQLILRSRRSTHNSKARKGEGGGSRTFTTLNVPGLGKGKNIVRIEDELKTEYVDRLEKKGLITIKHIPSNKGE